MSYWMSEEQKNELLRILDRQAGPVEGRANNQEAVLRVRMDLEAVDAQIKAAAAEERAAKASERNARYMFWSVMAAMVSAFASLATVIAVFWHH